MFSDNMPLIALTESNVCADSLAALLRMPVIVCFPQLPPTVYVRIVAAAFSEDAPGIGTNSPPNALKKRNVVAPPLHMVCIEEFASITS